MADEIYKNNFWETIAFGQHAPESLIEVAKAGKIDEKNYQKAIGCIRTIVEENGVPAVAVSDQLVLIMTNAGISEATEEVQKILDENRKNK